MTEESWKPVKHYEDTYEVSDLGRVRRMWYGKYKYLTPSNNSEYHNVRLSRSGIGESKKVHHLVMEAFCNTNLENIPKGIEVDHINGVKNDNRVENLRLISHSKNIQSAFDRKLTRRLKKEYKRNIENVSKPKNDALSPEQLKAQDLLWDEIAHVSETMSREKAAKKIEEMLRISRNDGILVG
uniref:Putative homing endonuclease n=1 Tax=viral metagenome TaxID=1070528 RepID=A0A6M3X703_9ZZZZ